MESKALDRRSRYSIRVMQQALFDLLQEKTLEEITVVDICKTADVNRGTFYKYYRDVPDMYEKTEDALVEKIHGLLPDMQPTNGINESFLRDVLQVLMKQTEFSFITQHRAFSERFAQKVMTLFTPYIHSMTLVYRPDISERESLLLTEYIMGGCCRVITYWLNSGMEIPAAEIDKYMTQMIDNSLRNETVK